MKMFPLFALVLILWLAVAGLAGANGIVNRPREEIASGSTSTMAGSVTLQATVGQPLIGVRTAGNVRLSQGFWHGREAQYLVHMPVVLKEQP